MSNTIASTRNRTLCHVLGSGTLATMARVPTCQACGGEMKKITTNKISAKKNGAARYALAIIVFFLGVVFFVLIPVTVIGLVGGLIVCIFSIFMVFHSEKVWQCKECLAIGPRG